MLAALLAAPPQVSGASPSNHRPPLNESELRSWLENMVWHHQFSIPEIQAATGLSPETIEEALRRFHIKADTRPVRPADAPLLVLPYPGGRHPRIGFLEGAIDPQRETKISVFLPWPDAGYVVYDIPEAIWSNLGLTYLAHTHIDTIWDTQKIRLDPREWTRHPDGSLAMSRRLPNGIEFGTRVHPSRQAVRMELWLTNGTSAKLTSLRVQNCVMLKQAADFNQSTNANKVLSAPFAACRDSTGRRWIITTWLPCQRTWANPPVPCLHSDPQFPDCEPGQTQRLRGWLSFYEGTDLQSEFERIRQDPWLADFPTQVAP